MTDYELDDRDRGEASERTPRSEANERANERRPAGEGAPERSGDDRERSSTSGVDPEESLGVAIPEEHVGAFVAEAFEDPERDTDWTEAVDAMVPESAREEWESLEPRAQVREMLSMADDYDRTSLERLESISLEGERTERTDDLFEEAERCRRNADLLRDAVADAYRTGRVDDDDLVGAVREEAFDTETIAAREDRLESVASVYEFDFRPYGGTLMDTDEESESDGYEVW